MKNATLFISRRLVHFFNPQVQGACQLLTRALPAVLSPNRCDLTSIGHMRRKTPRTTDESMDHR